jgi:glycosyltransferase involved in cell wall biosynthesis
VTKVLHIINGDLYAGAERVQDLLALHLPQFGYDVGLVTLKEGLFAKSRRAISTPLFAADMHHRLDIGITRRIATIARANDYRIIHTHSPRGAFIGAIVSGLTGLPMVHHVHGPTTHDTEHWWRNQRNSLIERICVRRARHVIPVSRYAAEYAHSLGLRDQRTTMIWNGVETSQAKFVKVDSDCFTLGAVALFRPRKGIEILIEAIGKLARVRREPFKLLMVGGFESSDYEQKIKTLARARGVADRIEWTGFTTDVERMLRRMDVFVLPSLYGEGLPMVILEAMAGGLPIVAASVGGVVEALEHRQQGLLVAPGDATAMCDAIAELADNRAFRTQLGERARSRQIEQFSAQSMAAAVAAVYGKCL